MYKFYALSKEYSKIIRAAKKRVFIFILAKKPFFTKEPYFGILIE